MNKALALLLLVALAFVAQSEAFYCRHSSYKLPCAIADKAKKSMFKSCKLNVKILGKRDLPNGCCVYRQRVADEATWSTYKGCEEAHPAYLRTNSYKGKKYLSLKESKNACAVHAFSGNCKA